jgi:hypothetical protein
MVMVGTTCLGWSGRVVNCRVELEESGRYEGYSNVDRTGNNMPDVRYSQPEKLLRVSSASISILRRRKIITERNLQGC